MQINYLFSNKKRKIIFYNYFFLVFFISLTLFFLLFNINTTNNTIKPIGKSLIATDNKNIIKINTYSLKPKSGPAKGLI